MTAFATLPFSERALILNEVAGRIGVVPVIVEKDFWVCWVLGHIFGTAELASHITFKGGTSLSKAHGAIDRFSEDIDLAVAPGALGISEQSIDAAPSSSQRRKRVLALATACEHCVRQRFQPALEATFSRMLGLPTTDSWLSFEVDAMAGTPNLLFNYPSALPPAGGYIAKQVKLEFGALTDQQPTETHHIAALLADAPGASLRDAFDDLEADVVVLALPRSFWEKATILHAEYHRPPKLPIRDRFARHYADLAALWQHPGRVTALSRLDILEAVIGHKSRYFASAWAHYETARPGSFHLVPPDFRHAELARDYAKMQPMFLVAPPSFEDLMLQLTRAERQLNPR